MNQDLPIDDAVCIPGSNLSWTASCASGSGGQNVNRVATKVDLRFDLENCATLRPAIKRRLRTIAAGRMDADGRLIVTCQATRTQARNLDLARAKLAELIRAALPAPKRRRATRPTRASKARRLDAKRRTAQRKAGRGKVSRTDLG